jgi:hypothetical protein
MAETNCLETLEQMFRKYRGSTGRDPQKFITSRLVADLMVMEHRSRVSGPDLDPDDLYYRGIPIEISKDPEFPRMNIVLQ